MHNFGCPNTEMRSRKEEFEKHELSNGLDLHMKKDAPHYSNHKTRFAYSQFVQLPVVKPSKIIQLFKFLINW